VGSSTPVPGSDPTKVSTSFNNRFHDNTMGVTHSGVARPNGVDFWWDSFPGNTGNCWWDNKAAPGKKVTSSPASLPDCAGGTKPSSSIGTGSPTNEAELVACLAGFSVSGYPAGNSTICSWSTTPSRPGSSSSPLPGGDAAQAQQAEFGSICANGLAPRLCAPYADWLTLSIGSLVNTAMDALSPLAMVEPAYSEGRLSSFTCSWWRKADDAHRLGMVQRISHFATGKIDGTGSYGYGAGLSDARAAALFDDRCSTFQAGPFALYKIYGAAAPFAALSR
jgi:hypothetical protein